MQPVSSNTADREIVLTRVFDAPRTMVFQAFTDPQHVDHWYGPRGFRTETTDMDVRPGGAWHYVMRHELYGEFKNRIVYREVVRPERLRYRHDAGVDDDPAAFEVTISWSRCTRYSRRSPNSKKSRVSAR